MRIALLYEETPGTWTVPYAEAMREACLGHEVLGLDVKDLHDWEIITLVNSLKDVDLWYCHSFVDRFLSPIMSFAEQNSHIMCHNHGGAETGDLCSLVRGEFDSKGVQLLSDDPRGRILFNTKFNSERFCRRFSVEGMSHRVVGFPIDKECTYYFKTHILVPGRFSESKQTLLSAKILEPFAPLTMFSTGSRDKSLYWSGLKALGYHVVEAIGEHYDRLLLTTKVAFTASMADSFNSSIAEAAASGAIVVAPNEPPFCDIYKQDFLYRPYDIVDAREKVFLALNSDTRENLSDVSRYNKHVVVDNIREVIAEVENERRNSN